MTAPAMCVQAATSRSRVGPSLTIRINNAATSVAEGGAQGWVIEIDPRRKSCSAAIARPQASASGVNSKTRRFMTSGIQAESSWREKGSERFCPLQKCGELDPQDNI